MNEHHEHLWARIRGVPGTRSFEVRCALCGKEALEIRPSWRPLSEWGWIAKSYTELVRELEGEGEHE